LTRFDDPGHRFVFLSKLIGRSELGSTAANLSVGYELIGHPYEAPLRFVDVLQTHRRGLMKPLIKSAGIGWWNLSHQSIDERFIGTQKRE
jgi:hypothetical protein